MFSSRCACFAWSDKLSWIRGELTHSSVPVSFYKCPWMAYQLPVGPCWPLFVEEKTTAAAFTGFSYPGSSKKKKKSPLNKQKTKVTLPWKQPQFDSTSRNSLLFLTPARVFFFLSLPYRHTHTHTHSLFSSPCQRTEGAALDENRGETHRFFFHLSHY